jgi:hypothetical protein
MTEVERIRQILETKVPNTEPTRAVVDKDSACFLVRQFYFSNLYDRFSTRPFLDAAEKRWIVYQLLQVTCLRVVRRAAVLTLLRGIGGHGVPRKQRLSRRHQD